MSSIINNREMRGSDFSVFISHQTEKDEIDATPAFTPVRRTEGKGNKVVSYVEDPSVNGAMQGLEQIQDGEDLTASISSVATKQTFQLLTHALHSDAVTLTLAAKTDIAITATGFTSASDEFTALNEGDGFWVTTATNPLNNIFYILTEKTDDGEIVTYPAPAATQAAGVAITLTAYKFNNADAPTYSAIQTRAVDLSKASDIDFHTMYNAVVNSGSLEIAETGLASASFEYVAELEVEGTAAIAGQTTVAKPTDRALTSRRNATAGIRDFYMDNESVRCTIKSFSFEINNNYSKDDASACGAIYIRGQPQFTGSAVARSRIDNPFELRDRQRNSIRTMFGIRVAHGGGHESYIVFRQAVLTEASQPDGNGVAASTEFSFGCEEHVETASTVAIYTNWNVATLGV